jgi:prepilin-type N-terminal cleavage/methylation domain-containing protein/prepilin-type processing-associated H-X9-DG protein
VRPHHRVGFTLIEVLVVVAIIALLISILVPSLRKAREVALITVCKAGLQQIGNNVANYQAEYKAYVPVVFGFGTGMGFQGEDPNDPEALNDRPAKNQLLSVALRKYSASTKGLAGKFDPNVQWTQQTKQEYMLTRMPAYYACPYVRDSGEKVNVDSEQTYINGKQYTIYRWSGRYETYMAFQWDGRVIRGVAPGSIKEPNGSFMPPDAPGPANGRLIDGRPKYSAISFNKARQPGINYPPPPGAITLDKKNSMTDPANNMARTWISNDARRLRSGSLSELTTVFCHQGMHLSYQYKMYNPGSHAMDRSGGTNALFADNHVEWIKGTMVGW